MRAQGGAEGENNGHHRRDDGDRPADGEPRLDGLSPKPAPRFFVHAGLPDSAAKGMERTAQGAIRTTFSAVLPKKIFSNSPLPP